MFRDEAEGEREPGALYILLWIIVDPHCTHLISFAVERVSKMGLQCPPARVW